jgi:hypothetical protein
MTYPHRPAVTPDDAATVVLTGEWRYPTQLLGAQQLTSGPTVHDVAVAAALNFSGAPIEGPTHFSQFVPLAMALWGESWLASSCISAHFTSPVTEGQRTQARVAAVPTADHAAISMYSDGGPLVLEGTISLASSAVTTTCASRLAAAIRPRDLRIVDQIKVGMSSEPSVARMTFDDPVGPLYPFTLNDKLAVITEPHEWYRSADNPWGAPLVPLEMIAPLLHQHNHVESLPISRTAVGLFLDQEIRVHDGPLLVGESYVVRREVAAIGGSRRTESCWLRTEATDAAGRVRATMLLHLGFLRDSVAT